VDIHIGVRNAQKSTSLNGEHLIQLDTKNIQEITCLKVSMVLMKSGMKIN